MSKRKAQIQSDSEDSDGGSDLDEVLSQESFLMKQIPPSQNPSFCGFSWQCLHYAFPIQVFGFVRENICQNFHDSKLK